MTSKLAVPKSKRIAGFSYALHATYYTRNAVQKAVGGVRKKGYTCHVTPLPMKYKPWRWAIYKRKKMYTK